MASASTSGAKKRKKKKGEWTNTKQWDQEDVDKLILSYKKTYKYFNKKSGNPYWLKEKDIIEKAITRLISKKYCTINKLEDLYKEIKVAINYKHDEGIAMSLSPTNIFINPFTFITKDKCYLSWEKVILISKNEYYYDNEDSCVLSTKDILLDDDYKSDLTLLERLIEENKLDKIYQSFYYAFIDNQKQVGNDLYQKPDKIESIFQEGYKWDSKNRKNKCRLPIKFDKQLFNSTVKNNPDICFKFEEVGQTLICPKWIYDWEVQASRWFEELYEEEKNSFFDINEINEFISNYEEERNMTFHKHQKQAIENGAQNLFSVITGLPGSGKTEVICCLIRYLKSKIENCKVSITAPTGKAYKNIEKRCQSELNKNDKIISGTLHKAVYQSFNKIRDWENAYNKFRSRLYEECPWPDVCIIDETSMCDMERMWMFLKHMKYFDGRLTPILIVIGDTNQLPSVGFGDVLNKIVISNKFCVTQLTKNWRSAAAPVLSHAIKFMTDNLNEPIPYEEKIKRGKWWNHDNSLTFTAIEDMKNITPTKSGEIEFNDKKNFAEFLVKKNYAPFLDRILTGENSSRNFINEIVQQRILKRTPEQRIIRAKKFSPEEFYEGDLVIRGKNCESFGSYWTNGEMGYVYKFTRENLERFLDIDEFRQIVKTNCYTKSDEGYILLDNKIILTKNRLNEDEHFEIPISVKYEAIIVYEEGVELIKRGELEENFNVGYATTVHKAQGSEYRQVFVWLGCKSWMYGGKRPQFFTAISRGVRSCHVIGNWENLPKIQKFKKNNIKSFFLDE